MNGWEMHKQDRTSNSRLKKFIEAPDAWITHYLYGERGTVGPAAHRGTAIEAGVVAVLANGHTMEEAIAAAHVIYERKTAFIMGDVRVEKEAKNIAPMIGQAVAALEQYGKPEFPDHGKQHEVWTTCQTDEWELPIQGFLDLVYPEHGLVVDLKTTTRMPSVMPWDHQNQRAIYANAVGNQTVKFLYVKPKEFAWKEDGDIPQILGNIKTQLIRQEKFLRMGDREYLRERVPVNPGTFYWNGMEDIRKKYYGI